jgi:hypothetical protein
VEPKEYERNWKPKNMKETGTERMFKKLEPNEYEILLIFGLFDTK